MEIFHLQKLHFFATEHAVVVTPKVRLVSRWLYHTLIVAELSKYVTKSAQPGLSVRRLEQVEVLFPSIEEQQQLTCDITNVKQVLL